jgi:hypothetical protein
MKKRTSVLLLCAAAALIAATTPNGRYLPEKGTPEYDEAKYYFVKWADPNYAELPIHMCDWSPTRKIAAVEVRRPALVTVVTEWVMLIERNGVKKQIRMPTMGKAAVPAQQAELMKVALFCAGRAPTLED